MDIGFWIMIYYLIGVFLGVTTVYKIEGDFEKLAWCLSCLFIWPILVIFGIVLLTAVVMVKISKTIESIIK